MAKRRKKYTISKRMQNLGEHLLRDVLVVYADTLGGCILFDRKRRFIIKPTDLLVTCVGMPHNWCCWLGAMGRTAIDKYIKAEVVQTKSKYRQADLAGFLEEQHLEVMRSVPEHHLCGVAWIASPTGYEVSQEEAADILDKVEAWK